MKRFTSFAITLLLSATVSKADFNDYFRAVKGRVSREKFVALFSLTPSAIATQTKDYESLFYDKTAFDNYLRLRQELGVDAEVSRNKAFSVGLVKEENDASDIHDGYSTSFAAEIQYLGGDGERIAVCGSATVV